MADVSKTRGTPLVIEAEFYQYTPFGSEALADPDALPTVTILDLNNIPIITAEEMTKNSTGKYYYDLQTEENWRPGAYSVEIKGAFAPMSERTLLRFKFILK